MKEVRACRRVIVAVPPPVPASRLVDPDPARLVDPALERSNHPHRGIDPDLASAAEPAPMEGINAHAGEGETTIDE